MGKIEYPQPARLLPRVIAGCRACPRLVAYMEELKRINPVWWNRPVPGFGDPEAGLLILGLAPGRAGANRTGRPFTGDAAGVWLYEELFNLGCCSRSDPFSVDDGTLLRGVYITNAVKCVPPGNQPQGSEKITCRPLLERELALLPNLRAVLVLGGLARSTLATLHVGKEKLVPFGHGAQGQFVVGKRKLQLICSYHSSRLNTNTGRLTRTMWRQVLREALKLGAVEG